MIMNVYDKIITSNPINKSAAMVTSQTEYEETERQKLVKEIQYLNDAICAAKLHKNLPLEKVKAMGLRKLELQNLLTETKSRKKKIMTNSIEFYFMEICRENMHKLDFQKYLKMACDKRGD